MDVDMEVPEKRKRKYEDADVGSGSDDETTARLEGTRFVDTAAAARAKAHALAQGDQSINPELLKIYYDRLFPVSTFFRWLSYSDNNELIKRREFSFTLKDDVYIRYISFKSKEELKAGLVSKVPYKIDLGAVFNAPPNMHTSVPNFTPLSKELVFDVDMTDYDDVRTCCKGADICLDCWPLMTAAVKVVDTALREDFGFQHLLWVYSGRRGVHCWVCDKVARELDNNGRTAVIEYLSLGVSEKQSEMNLRHPLHPSLQRAYELLLPYFEMLCESQGLFATTEKVLKVMALCKVDKEHEDELKWTERELGGDDDDGVNVHRWHMLRKKVGKLLQKLGNKAPYSLRTVVAEIVFKQCYPRLDVNVSKQLNHLLKAPFCVHPKTGKVCVPMDPARCDEFDPLVVPRLNALHDELNTPLAGGGKRAAEDTSLEPYLTAFREFVRPMIESERAENRADKLRSGQGVEEIDW